jgi:hypothetical protein
MNSVDCEHTDARFCVEADHNPYKQEEAAIERCFVTRADAVAAAEELTKKFKAVWISEWGVGSRGEGWFWFWWSQAVKDADWGERPDTNVGYAYGGSKYLERYSSV